jgi:NAD(P)-dependent dehydrogenase (short-subunit alcohol dehydrogenase family)
VSKQRTPGGLSGKVGIITGAGEGMGKAMALSFSACGAKLILADIVQETARELEREISAAGGSALALKADVSHEADVQGMVEACIGNYGRIDFLVSNAGTVGPYNFDETSVEDWDKVFAVNTRGGFLCAKHVLPHMQKRRSGRILFIASTNGGKPGGYVIAYRASKAGLIMLARSLALFAAPFGITVNAICPGVTMTPMQRRLTEDVLEQKRLSFEEYVQERAKRVPMGRFTEVKDIADAAEFLISDRAGFITGQAIYVNGGEW